MIERQTEDILRQIASSSEYSLHELSAIRQTKTRPQNVDMATDDIDVDYFLKNLLIKTKKLKEWKRKKTTQNFRQLQNIYTRKQNR